jgi:hypothetical protein
LRPDIVCDTPHSGKGRSEFPKAGNTPASPTIIPPAAAPIRATRRAICRWVGPQSSTSEGRLRLYRASVHEYCILDPDVPLDVRVKVRP